MGVRPRVQKHRRPRERGVQYRLQRDPALKLRSMITESPSGRLVACSLEVFSFFSFGNYYLEGFAAAGLGPMSWWHVSFYFIIFFGS